MNDCPNPGYPRSYSQADSPANKEFRAVDFVCNLLPDRLMRGIAASVIEVDEVYTDPLTLPQQA